MALFGTRAALTALMLVSMPAVAGAACEGARASQVAFSDNFDRLDPAWGPEAPDLRTEGGRLVLDVAPGQQNFNAPGYEWGDAYVCAAVAVAAGDPVEVVGGIMFWVVDAQNYWVFLVNGAGQATIEAMENGNSRTVWPWEAYPALNQGVGVVNRLKVTIVIDQATIHINDTPVRFVEANGLPRKWLVGIMARAFDTGGTFAFEDFEIAAPQF